MNRSERRKAEKIVVKHIDNIYSSSLKIAKAFESNSLALVTFKEVLNKSKLDPVDEIKVFANNYNDTLDKLYNLAVSYCIDEGKKEIPLTFIKSSLEIIKQGFKNTLKVN